MKLSNRSIALIVSLLLIASLVYFFTEIVAYVCVAWVLSMIGQPLMRFFRQRLRIWKFRPGPNMAAMLTLFSFFLVVFVFIWLFVPPIVTQVNNLAGVDYAAIAKALEQPLEHLQKYLAEFGILDPTESLAQQLQGTFSSYLEPSSLGNYFREILSAFGSILVAVVSILFITFFFLKEDGLFVSFLTAVMPEQYDSQVRRSISDTAHMLSRYFRGLVLQMLSVAVFVTLALTFFGIKNALLIGVFAAMLNVIPYVGPIIGMFFGIVFTISSGLDLDFYTQMLPMLGKVALVFLAAQMLDNYVLQPFIFSNSVMAHPLEIFIIILMGAQLAGVWGMVLAIPFYTVLRAVARAFLSEFNIVQRLTERMK